VSRALPLTQRQAQALIRAAEAEKAIVEVVIGTTVVRLVPASLAPKPKQGKDRDIRF
jgi:hypothetical protein